ncbi:TrkH family potassium uptake protein [Corynebacterium tapiri]|uniref:TrkH family potassium uptake protein n=1 Tax=Corynebacterium tapiri TaxID=1448266 RepID=A0A5C4U343_9CORY|nr:potassium transporter TrkG [Corynebacterium tapiri]TNL97404.1 TrkH family potassium uptake protein [Corynebacterium tapiri]
MHSTRHDPTDRHALAPARLAAAGLTGLVALGTVALASPWASTDHHPTALIDALFTAVSAASLTGLVTVDTSSHFNLFGQIVILALIQISGLGVMSLASLLGMVLRHRLSLRHRRVAEAEGRGISSRSIKGTLQATVMLTLVVESVIAAVLALRFALAYGHSWGQAIWLGVFHSISAFNNAGFSLQSDSLIGFVGDWFIIGPISLAIIVGGLGYPVLAEVQRRCRGTAARPWSVTSRITLLSTAALIIGGALVFALTEHRHTFSGLGPSSFAAASTFASVTARTAGFNSIDYGQASPITLMMTDALMFIGGGSAGTAGGVKVTTVAVLAAAVLAEYRGREHTTVGRRMIPSSTVRQAMAVMAAGIFTVVIATALIRALEPHFDGDAIVFEVVSAFGTVGLSTGITGKIGAASQLILAAVMFLGRLGPFTLVASLALRHVDKRFSYPEERPYIG